MQDSQNSVRVFWLISEEFGTIPKYTTAQTIMPVFMSSEQKKRKKEE